MKLMDHSPFRQTSELGIYEHGWKEHPKFSKLVKCGCKMLQNIVKCGKYSPVKFANFVYFCIMREKV